MTQIPDWQDVVRRVSGWLQDAAAKLDRHESEFQTRFPAETAPRPKASEALADRVRELPEKLKPLDGVAAEGPAAEVETKLREFARRSESLRLRLAEGVGRAIG